MRLSDLYNSEKVDSIEIKNFYDSWAKSYDVELEELGYQAPLRCAEVLRSVAKTVSGRVLDIGCGTGLSGSALSSFGFTVIDGLDISDNMLALAREKGIYSQLFNTDVFDFMSSYGRDYLGVLAVGSMGLGHIPAQFIAACVDNLSTVGFFVFTLNEIEFQLPAFQIGIQEVVSSGLGRVVCNECGDHIRKQNMGAYVVCIERQ